MSTSLIEHAKFRTFSASNPVMDFFLEEEVGPDTITYKCDLRFKKGLALKISPELLQEIDEVEAALQKPCRPPEKQDQTNVIKPKYLFLGSNRIGLPHSIVTSCL